MTPSTTDLAWRDIYFTSRDGLRLHARHYPAEGSTRRPLLCLPGLTRNAADFHLLASTLADPRGHRRNVYAMDFRGRGRSDHDPDWRNYSPLVEMLDVIDFMTLAGIAEAAILGTSRGGIVAMAMATQRPTAFGAVILNDIGPVIERDGLARIIGYVGRVPLPATWEEAAALTADLNRTQFPAVPEEEWLDVARQLYNEEGGQPVHGYDQKLARSLSLEEGPLPTFWPQFDALARVPMLVIRGENSDILSAATVEEMRKRHPAFDAHVVRGQGHAPLLRDRPSIERIAEFLIATDGGA